MYFFHCFKISGKEVIMVNFDTLEWLLQRQILLWAGDHQVHLLNKYGNNAYYFL